MMGSAATVTSISLSCDSTACMTWRTTAESSTTKTWIRGAALSCNIGLCVHFDNGSIDCGDDTAHHVMHRVQALRVPHKQVAARREVTQQAAYNSFPVFSVEVDQYISAKDQIK